MTITYFEFGTLAAMDVFHQMSVDVAVMEVGIGGELDAVNIFDADVALITALDLDHQKWLGSDRVCWIRPLSLKRHFTNWVSITVLRAVTSTGIGLDLRIN